MRVRKKLPQLFIGVVAVLFGTIAFGNNARAAEVKETENKRIVFRQAVSDENTVKAYIRTDDGEKSASYQIGNIPVDSLKLYGIEEDIMPVHTLVLVDNSLSIPKVSRDKVGELLNSVVEAHIKNEQFRIGTFSDCVSYLSDNYSDDYTAVKNMAASITYQDQETYLTDVLYDVLDELNTEHYMGFTRILIISDGVDNKPLGVTREELNLKIKENPYPIYTAGAFTGKNNEQLENLFALSRITDSEYGVLEDEKDGIFSTELSKDADMIVLEAAIPKEAKAGGKQSSRLTFEDGRQLAFEVQMPFSIRENTKETVEETLQKESTEIGQETTVVDTDKAEGKAVQFVFPVIIGLMAALLVVLAVVLIRQRKNRKAAEVHEPKLENESVDADNTEMLGNEKEDCVLPKQGKNVTGLRYKMTLTDRKDLSKSYQCELRNSISIGRVTGNDIVIDVTGVSKKHCMILNKNGRIFIQDSNSTNGTFVDGEKIHFDTEIFSGTNIRVGKAELIIKLERV